MKKLLAVLSIFILIGGIINAMSSVYFCTTNGAAGWVWDRTNLSQADTDAYNACIQYGGKTPKMINHSQYPGYGVVMFGEDSYGAQWVSASLSYSNLDDAVRASSASLQKCGAIYKMEYYYFYDTK